MTHQFVLLPRRSEDLQKVKVRTQPGSLRLSSSIGVETSTNVPAHERVPNSLKSVLSPDTTVMGSSGNAAKRYVTLGDMIG